MNCMGQFEEPWSPRAKTEANFLTFVTTLNPNNINLFPIVKLVFQLLQEAEQTKYVLSKYNLIKRQRQPPNLKKLLASAK